MAHPVLHVMDTFESTEAFRAFVKNGALYTKCFPSNNQQTEAKRNESITPSNLPTNINGTLGGISIQEWRAMSDIVCNTLNISIQDHAHDKQELLSIQKRIFHTQIPLFNWIRVQFHMRSCQTEAMLVGLSAPQGCGKTTIVKCIQSLLSYSSLRSCVLSIDDFYLRGEEQDALHSSNPSNQIFKYRGSAGTHDVELGQKTLQDLKSSLSSTTPVDIRVPSYDKSARMGLGDRRKTHHWTHVTEAVDVILFEGWMLGFKNLTNNHSDLHLSGIPGIHQVNEHLEAYHKWHDLVDCWIAVHVSDLSDVYKWRMQQEREQRERQKSGLTDEEVVDFVDRFMASYKTYLPTFLKHGPAEWRPNKPLLRFTVDHLRNPTSLLDTPTH